MALFKAKTSTIPDLCPPMQRVPRIPGHARAHVTPLLLPLLSLMLNSAVPPAGRGSRAAAGMGRGVCSLLDCRQKFCTMQSVGNLKANANNMEHFNAQWYESQAEH